MKAAVQRFSLKNSAIVAVVHDEAAKACLAGRILWEDMEWDSEVCVAHRLQTAIRHAIDVPQISKLTSSARRLVAHFRRSALATEALLRKQQTSVGKTPSVPKRLIQDVSTRWNSTFFMLERLVQLR